ncbi:MAG TPA: Calx-beta domain-containing protein, partial [Pyrinomonadaceae bacterium]
SDYAQTGAATFGSTSGTVTFSVGASTATVTLNPTTDATAEADETAILTVTSGTGYIVGSPSVATGTITNDDTDVIVTLSPISVTETGAANLIYTFTRTGVTTSALTVNFSVAGTATLNTDYSQTGAATFSDSAGTVTFSVGDSSATVTLNPTPDATLEGDEDVTLTVTSGSGYNVGTPSATTGTITPDAPIVFTEEGNDTFAVAVDSVTLARGPFRLVNDYNFSADKLTRVILVTSPLGMTQADLATPNLLSVHIAGFGTLPIENVGAITGVPGLSASYIVVKLPVELQSLNLSPGPNNLTLTVKMGSAESNAAILRIIP